MQKETKNVTYVKQSGSFISLLTLLFIALKLLDKINWSWLWVLSPLWITFLVWVFIVVVAFVVLVVGAYIAGKK